MARKRRLPDEEQVLDQPAAVASGDLTVAAATDVETPPAAPRPTTSKPARRAPRKVRAPDPRGDVTAAASANEAAAAIATAAASSITPAVAIHAVDPAPPPTIGADQVRIKGGDAGSIVADEVTILQGGARQIRARSVNVAQGGAALIQGQDVRVDQGGAFAIVGRRVEISNGAAFLVIAREVRGAVLLDWRGVVAFVLTVMLVRRLRRFRRHQGA